MIEYTATFTLTDSILVASVLHYCQSYGMTVDYVPVTYGLLRRKSGLHFTVTTTDREAMTILCSVLGSV